MRPCALCARLRKSQTPHPPVTNPTTTVITNTESTYTYDELDNLTAVDGPDASGNPTVRTSIAYDTLGRKTSMTGPDMGAWQYRYDSVGNLTR